MSYRQIDRCRCCGGRELVQYLDLGDQPLANAYHKGETTQERFPLRVNMCPVCFHSQLSIAIDPLTLFSNYLYVSGVSKTFQEHCSQMAQDIIGRMPRRELAVLDIGCNDGTLLDCFRDLGCRVAGVDPAKNLRALTEAKGIPVVVEPWGADVASQFDAEFDVITATNIFAHVNDNAEFLVACRKALASDGLVVIEVPHCGKLIANREFDTIYHEHMSYFLVNSFQRLAARCGFAITHMVRSGIHGGSIRFYLRKGKGHCSQVPDLITAEAVAGLYDHAKYGHFATEVEVLRKEIRDLMLPLNNKIGYGASAKGNVMLNYCDLSLEYIVDDTPQKQGYLTPGKNIPIVGREQLRADDRALNILVLSWNFLGEILDRIRAVRQADKADHYIVHCPAVLRSPL